MHNPLPVFGPADELVPFVSLEADYFWVKRQNWWPLDDVDSMVYDGAHLYPRVSVLYMLERCIIKLEDVMHQLTASRHFSEFPRAVAAIHAAWGSNSPNAKLMINSCIGLWNQHDRYRWAVHETGVFDDMSRVDFVVSQGDEPPKCDAATRVVGHETCFPIGLIALHWECITVHRAHRALQPTAKIFGVNVDGIFFKGRAGSILEARHPDGSPIYQIKEGRMELCPTKPQAFDDHEREIIEMPEWRHVDDGDLDAIAQKVVAHGSALITGPAGTGETWLNRLINARLQGKVVNTAMTHAASRLMPGGKTVAQLLNVNRYGRVRDTTFCVDEIGMVPLSTLVRLGSWQLLGSKFIMYGDFKGQFEPIYDQWRGDVENSGIVRQLAGGLHVHLTVGRRSDQAHFRFYTGLYPSVGQPVGGVAALARAQYP